MTAAFWNRFSKPMMGLAMVVMVMGAVFAIHAVVFQRDAIRARATIAQLVATSGDSGTTYAPVFVFRDMEGVTRKVCSSVSSYPPIGAVGDKITVLYSPGKPNGARVDTFFSIWGIPVILGGCGTFYLVLFLGVWIVTKRMITTANQAATAPNVADPGR